MSEPLPTGAAPAPAGTPPPVRTRRSIFVQFVRNAVLFALVTLSLLFAVTVSETRRNSEGALTVSVATDMAALVDVYVSGGERELVDRVRDRSGLTGPEGRQARYLLMRPGGTVLAGNIGSWPALNPLSGQTGYVELDDGTTVYGRFYGSYRLFAKAHEAQKNKALQAQIRGLYHRFIAGDLFE